METFPESYLKNWLCRRHVWNHDDWLNLLEGLRKAGYSSLTDSQEGRDSIGCYLEANRPKPTENDKHQLVKEMQLFEQNTIAKVRLDRHFSDMHGGGPFDNVTIAFILGAISAGLFSEIGKDLWTNAKKVLTKLFDLLKTTNTSDCCDATVVIQGKYKEMKVELRCKKLAVQQLRLDIDTEMIYTDTNIEKVLDTMRYRLSSLISELENKHYDTSMEYILVESIPKWYHTKRFGSQYETKPDDMEWKTREENLEENIRDYIERSERQYMYIEEQLAGPRVSYGSDAVKELGKRCVICGKMKCEHSI